MSQSIEEQMLDAFELFQYSHRFQNQLFVLVLEEGTELSDLITDLRVLQISHVNVMICCKNENYLNGSLATWNSLGGKFQYFTSAGDSYISDDLIDSLRLSLSQNFIPVYALATKTQDELDIRAINIADQLGAGKIFILSNEDGLIVNGRLQSHPNINQLNKILANNENLNIPASRLQLFQEVNRKREIEVVLLSGKSGCLFQEIFTHRGSGTLFSSEYPNIIREGKKSDVVDIYFLMKHHLKNGSILPLDLDKITAEIRKFMVYTVNNSIVASAKLTDYGDGAEMAKFCTLPRYQGKGRAKELGESLIQQAKEQGKKFVFALSIEKMMWAFFLNLGLKEVPREKLPEEWQRNYDFSRPSKAFMLEF